MSDKVRIVIEAEFPNVNESKLICLENEINRFIDDGGLDVGGKADSWDFEVETVDQKNDACDNNMCHGTWIGFSGKDAVEFALAVAQIKQLLTQPDTDDAHYVLRTVYETMGIDIPDFLKE